MKNEKILSKLNEIVSKESSKWLEKAQWRKANREWLEISAKIAIKIIRELRAKNLSQKDLAESISVSPQYINKIVKGQENLSLETINKLEKALGIALFEIPEIRESLYNKFVSVQPSVSMEYMDYNYPIVTPINLTLETIIISEKTIFPLFYGMNYSSQFTESEFKMPLAA